MKKYCCKFDLSKGLKDFERAKKYVGDGDTNFAEYAELPFVKTIKFYLENVEGGRIDIESENTLSKKEKDLIENYISGQCTDGIGEGLEQHYNVAMFISDEGIFEL